MTIRVSWITRRTERNIDDRHHQGGPRQGHRQLHGDRGPRPAVLRDLDRARPAGIRRLWPDAGFRHALAGERRRARHQRSEEHTSELQSLMRNSYAVFCLKKKKKTRTIRKI